MATLTLRPNSDEDTNYNWIGVGWSDYGYYECVDEVSPDADTTHYRRESIGSEYTEYALHGLPNHTIESGIINFIKVYIRCKYAYATCYARARIKTHTTDYEGDEETLTDSYATYSKQWNTNPNTTSAWTWTEIDDLIAGVTFRTTAYNITYCTQVYVEVDYTEEAPTAMGAQLINMNHSGITTYKAGNVRAN